MHYRNGAKYVGEWWSDERHGRGRLEKADGTVVDTHWDHDIQLEQSGGYQSFKNWQRKHIQNIDLA